YSKHKPPKATQLHRQSHDGFSNWEFGFGAHDPYQPLFLLPNVSALFLVWCYRSRHVLGSSQTNKNFRTPQKT
ncbi:MAG: hypothetical protein QG594_934, partial [Bacteroidota bacterium]|nr:hypothetical protein [Bacteroidota bacterium]